MLWIARENHDKVHHVNDYTSILKFVSSLLMQLIQLDLDDPHLVLLWSELWGQTAEYVSKYIDKGARVGVVGTLQIDEWSDSETGQKRNKAKVIVREFDLLETKAEADLRRQNTRGPSLYTGDDDVYDPSTGSSGGFFD